MLNAARRASDEHLDDFAVLVAGLAADGGHAAVRSGSRRPQLENLALDVEHGARPHRSGPGDFSAGAHDCALLSAYEEGQFLESPAAA
jgi:hypothetical protein